MGVGFITDELNPTKARSQLFQEKSERWSFVLTAPNENRKTTDQRHSIPWKINIYTVHDSTLYTQYLNYNFKKRDVPNTHCEENSR